MGDHFVLIMDRLLTESTLESILEARMPPLPIEDTTEMKSCHKIDFGNVLYNDEVVECRICQDEDEDANMEAPCSCCGTLKYAHRRCVQKWCNQKGDTVCEICRQQFKPGYTAPLHNFQFKDIRPSIREIRGENLDDAHFITMVATDHNFANSECDEFSSSRARSFTWWRLGAVILMLLLILCHTLPLIILRDDDYPLSSMDLILLTIGVILSIYIIFTTAISMRREPDFMWR